MQDDTVLRRRHLRTHLEVILCYTVKSLSGLEESESLDATSQERTSDFPKSVKRFMEKTPTAVQACRAGTAQRLTEKREWAFAFRLVRHSSWASIYLSNGRIKIGSPQ